MSTQDENYENLSLRTPVKDGKLSELNMELHADSVAGIMVMQRSNLKAAKLISEAASTLERNQVEHRAAMQESVRAFKEIYITAVKGFVRQLEASLDPDVPGSMPRKLLNFVSVIKDSAMNQVVKAGNEQVGRLSGAEDGLANAMATLNRLVADIDKREATVAERETKVATAEAKIKADKIESLRITNLPKSRSKQPPIPKSLLDTFLEKF